MKIVDYKVVVIAGGNYHYPMEQEVLPLMGEGWEPLGGIAVEPGGQRSQVMVKYDRSEETLLAEQINDIPAAIQNMRDELPSLGEGDDMREHKPFHLIMTNSFKTALIISDMAMDRGQIVKRTSRHSGYFADGTEYRIVHLTDEIRCMRPTSYQIMWLRPRDWVQRHRADEHEYYLMMCDSEQKDLLQEP